MKDCQRRLTMWIAILMIAAAVSIGAPSQALAVPLDLLSDSIYYSSGGINATDGWQSPSTSISWDITAIVGGWHYSYSWTAPTKGLSQFILEVSDGALASDFSNFSTTYTCGRAVSAP